MEPTRLNPLNSTREDLYIFPTNIPKNQSIATILKTSLVTLRTTGKNPWVLGRYLALACQGGWSAVRRSTVKGIIAPEMLGVWVIEALLIKFLVKFDAKVEAGVDGATTFPTNSTIGILQSLKLMPRPKRKVILDWERSANWRAQRTLHENENGPGDGHQEKENQAIKKRVVIIEETARMANIKNRRHAYEKLELQTHVTRGAEDVPNLAKALQEDKEFAEFISIMVEGKAIDAGDCTNGEETTKPEEVVV
ncbi:hypothetical protein B9Z19DRAFT_1123126 [Tuber borchii]|uniref:Uncharacterized protein n=1 Tax=Tuber borchii TaxID=42251 RepID=A0A2T6ZZ77_TUBBO|nr:hypothetical protein B9Z19DRAFT_1123126 [Tuber borchii]